MNPSNRIARYRRPALWSWIWLLLSLSPLCLRAQTNYDLTVLSGTSQTFTGFGASQAALGDWSSVPDVPRSTMTDQVYLDLKCNVLRLWIDSGATMTAETMASQFYTRWIGSGAIDEITRRGVTTLLLAPARGPAAPTEAVSGYAAKIAEMILIVKNNWNVRINVTGVCNEPSGWSPTQITDATRILRQELDARNLQDVAIIGSEDPNNDNNFFAKLDAMYADSAAWGGLFAIASHSYNMAAVANSENRKRGKDFWITESSTSAHEDPEDGQKAATISARFLNDLNHGVDRWIYFIGFGKETNVTTATDNATKLMVYDQATATIVPNLKYYYIKQLLNTFEIGAGVRKVSSATEGDMAYTYGQKPAINAVAALNPDGSWAIGIVNDTGVTTANPNTSQWYAAQSYNVTVTIQELAAVSSMDFRVFRSSPNTHFVDSGVVQVVNGVVTLPLASLELVCLRSASNQIPSAPQLTVSAEANPVALKWTPVWDATEYRIKRASSVQGPYVEIANTTGTSYVDAAVVNYTAYYYSVSAVNTYGEGSNSNAVESQPRPSPTIVDNADTSGVTIQGAWTLSTSPIGFYGPNYRHDGNTGSTGGKSIRYTPNLPEQGEYDVYLRWCSNTNRASNVPIDITHAAGVTSLSVDQRTLGGAWVNMGRFSFNAGTQGNVLVRNDGANGFVIADAVKWVQVSAVMSAPAAPTQVTVSPANNQATLTWSPINNADTYTVKRSESLGGPYTVIADGLTGLSYTDESVLNGAAYYYVVFGVNELGDGAYSSEVSIIPGQYIRDNSDATGITIIGAWTTGTAAPGYYGTSFLHDGNTGAQGGKSVRFAANLPVSGSYDVFLRWTAGSNRADNTPVEVVHAGISESFSINQKTDGGAWVPLGSFTFGTGTIDGVTVSNANANGFVIADAVMYVKTTASASINMGNLSQTYDGNAKSVSVTTNPVGLNVSIRYNGSETLPVNAGDYLVTASIDDLDFTGSASATLHIEKAVASAVFTDTALLYDGNAKTPSFTTSPGNLNLSVTYSGSTTAPVYPGTYLLDGVIDDPNYTGTASGILDLYATATVRHAPTIDGFVDGSVHVLAAENIVFNSGASMTGDLLVPGTPSLTYNGTPLTLGVKDGPGASAPTGYSLTLNSGALIRYIIRRVDPTQIEDVTQPIDPTGNQDITLNAGGSTTVNFATLRNLTLNSNVGEIALPPGNYGSFIINDGSSITIGEVGSLTPTVYCLQNLTLNGSAAVHVVGPVLLKLRNGTALNGSVGNSDEENWLSLQVYSGNLTLNSGARMWGQLIVPNGTVSIGGNAELFGRIVCDRLTLNSGALLSDPHP